MNYAKQSLVFSALQKHNIADFRVLSNTIIVKDHSTVPKLFYNELHKLFVKAIKRKEQLIITI